jgi:hypothetical protein
MANFSYNSGVPNANNDPGVDQPDMLLNAQSIASIWEEDHVGFNANNGGKHTHVTLVNVAVPPLPQSNPSSFLGTQFGVAAPTAPELYFTNSLTTMLLSGIKAFAQFDNNGNAIGSTFNCTVSKTGTGNFTVTLPANTVVSASNYLVLITPSMPDNFAVGGIVGYSNQTSAGFHINCRAFTGGNTGADPSRISFVVIEW